MVEGSSPSFGAFFFISANPTSPTFAVSLLPNIIPGTWYLVGITHTRYQVFNLSFTKAVCGSGQELFTTSRVRPKVFRSRGLGQVGSRLFESHGSGRVGWGRVKR